MKKLLLTILALVSTVAIAQEFKLPDNLNLSGFIYNTTFGDKDWQNGRTVGAVNVDYHTGNFAVRTQLSTYSDQPVRRAVIEYSHPIGSSTEMTYQLGRFTRLESFYEGITDNPGNYNQAILPMAGYSYRMFNGAFVIMDGVKAQAKFKLPDDYLLSFIASTGKMTIPSQSDIQKEAFRKVYPGVSINSSNHNYDWGIHLDTANWHYYISRNRYHMDVDTDGSNATANAVSATFNDIDYKLDKAGIRWDNQKYLAQLEWFHDITEIWKKAGTISSNNNAIGYNWLLGYYPSTDWLVYAGRSYGANKVALSHNDDNYVGVTYNWKQWTASMEYHKGNGFAWRKYDAPFVAAPNIPNWSSWVASLTYRF